MGEGAGELEKDGEVSRAVDVGKGRGGGGGGGGVWGGEGVRRVRASRRSLVAASAARMRSAIVSSRAEGHDFGPESLGPIAVIQDPLANDNAGTVSSEQRARILNDRKCLARTIYNLRAAWEDAWACVMSSTAAAVQGSSQAEIATRAAKALADAKKRRAQVDIPMHDSWDAECSDGGARPLPLASRQHHRPKGGGMGNMEGAGMRGREDEKEAE